MRRLGGGDAAAGLALRLGRHLPHGTVLCGSPLCVVSGEWHIAGDIPRNDLLGPLREVHWALGGFPTYMATAFILPLLYGAWRFVLFHAAVGPVLAWQLTSNPNEMPAVWCLFSIGIVLASLSLWLRARLTPGPRRAAQPGTP